MMRILIQLYLFTTLGIFHVTGHVSTLYIK